VKIKQGFARPQKAMTLLEMMIVLAIFGILLSAVVPSAVAIIDKSRITAQLNHMSSVIQYTRFHAIDKHMSAALCPSSDLTTCDVNDWNLPKMLFADSNFNQQRDDDEPLIYATPKMPKGVYMTGPKKLIRFFEDGAIGSPATILICPQQTNAKLNRALFISLQGRVRVSRDTNNDEVHEKGNGQALPCI
jgi:type IV fimbrial biogenesis protein FimT